MKKYKQKMMKHYVCSVARVMACVSFLILAIIGVSSLVRAMSLEQVANENGIPTAWSVASLGNPETITVPITYWDQRQDDCSDPNRQFEWTQCRLYAKGIIQGVVQNQLGSDGLPVPSYDNNKDAWAAYHDVFTANVTGSNPVKTTDNFYRWFHEAYDENGKQLSKQINREITFHRTGNNTYEYGSKGTFPLDNVNFSKDDEATKTGHNFHFTAHLRIPMKIAADGSEQFWFSGDDDVWVFLNGQLVLDLGGLHMDTEGYFTINKDGNVVSTVSNVADQTCRQKQVYNPLAVGYDTYNSQVDNNCPRKPKTTTINTNFKPGDVVNLDFFYAERSTSESNTRITITNMNWPIAADSTVSAKVAGKVENSTSNIVQFNTSITNRDPDSPLDLERMASYISETTEEDSQKGYLPLSLDTLEYTTTPSDPNSWQPVDITPPANNAEGFNLVTPLRMTPHGQEGDTLYFRYFGETSEYSGSMTNVVSYYTSMNGTTGFTYDYDTISYTGYEKPATHKVNISYIYAEDGSEAYAPYETELETGKTFSVPSPEIDGFTPDIFEVSGTVKDSDLNFVVKYTKKPEEPEPKSHTVIIHYVYEDGKPAADDYKKDDFKPGDEFEVASPKIEGFTPDQEVVKDTIGDEEIREIFVYYTKVAEEEPDTPIPPVSPIEPSDPSTPSQPEEPEKPGSDIIDNPLDFTPPLGEVVIIPNTGIISDTVAPIFEQYFANVILSQGFVLVALLIFAGSFATYFSLRKYLDLDMATRMANNRKPRPMPKNLSKTRKTASKPVKLAKSTTKAKPASASSTRAAAKKTKAIPKTSAKAKR